MTHSLVRSLSAALIMFGASASITVPAPAQKFAAPESAPVFDIPLLEKIVIDGDAGDWGSAGFAVNALTDASGKLRPASDFDATVRLGWNQEGLLVLARVQDNIADEGPDGSLWSADSIELFLAPKRGASDLWQAMIAPGNSAAQSSLRTSILPRTTSPELKDIKGSVTAARTRIPGGYMVEALLPWANLRITPGTGREVGFQIYVNDRDGGERMQSLWYPEAGVHNDSKRMQRLRLAEKPSRPVDVVVNGNYERFRRTRVSIMADGNLAGRTVQVREGRRVLGTAKLVADTAALSRRRASAELVLPMPPIGQTYGPVQVAIDGAVPTPLALPDARQLRRRAFETAPFAAKPAVFSGDQFPPLDFEQPSTIEDLIGEYTARATFYDRDYNLVTKAATPGRYGAIVDITGANGATYKRFVTLYRQPEAFNWAKLDLAAPITLPPAWGIDSTVVAEQSKLLHDKFRGTLQAGTSRAEGWAEIVAGLAETKPGDGTSRRNNVWARDHEWWYGLKKRTGNLVPYRYLLQLPPGYQADAGKEWPVLLFLHGSGERGDDLERVKTHGPPRLINEGRPLPFIVVSPQCPAREQWSPLLLNDVLNEITTRYRVDLARVYLTGLSMGGYGTWNMAMRYPERFAAIAPICGGGDAESAGLLKNVPAWIFHGAKDETVPLAEGQMMADAMRQAGAEVRFTVYPEANHDSWTESYNNPQLYEWLLQHVKR